MSIYAKEEIEWVRAEYEAEIRARDEMIAKLKRQLTLEEVAKAGKSGLRNETAGVKSASSEITD
jgi:hypothetical protein